MTIGVVGAGKIGVTIATLLESCAFCDAVVLADVRTGVKVDGLGKASVTKLDAKRRSALTTFVKRCDAIVCALPFFLNREIVETCARTRVAYFDLTEDVATTTLVRTLADRAKGVTFIPQCGLAPGAINIVGGALASSLDSVRSVEMRVGALPLTASNQMKYYLSWSTAGLINEYCQLGEALHGGRRIATLPLDGVERLTIDGVEYEAFNTVRRRGDHVRDVRGPCRRAQLQDDPLSRPSRPDEVSSAGSEPGRPAGAAPADLRSGSAADGARRRRVLRERRRHERRRARPAQLREEDTRRHGRRPPPFGDPAFDGGRRRRGARAVRAGSAREIVRETGVDHVRRIPVDAVGRARLRERRAATA